MEYVYVLFMVHDQYTHTHGTTKVLTDGVDIRETMAGIKQTTTNKTQQYRSHEIKASEIFDQ